MLIRKEVTSVQSFEYIRTQLISDKTLSAFLNQQNLEGGKVYAFVPDDISESQLYDFNIGGLYTSEKKLIDGSWLSKIINEAKPRVKDVIKNYLNDNLQHYCIFEECNGTTNSPWVINSKIEYMKIREELYYFFDKKNNIGDKLEKAFLYSGGWYFLCVLSSLSIEDHNKLLPFTEISPALISTIAKNATAFFVDAYDKEGYLMWERSNVSNV